MAITPDIMDTPADTPALTGDRASASALAFGITKELIAAYPELQEVYDLFSAGNSTDATLKYYDSPYYKDLTSKQQARGGMKATRPGAYATELESYRLDQKQRLAQRGIKMDDAQLNIILDSAYEKGFTDSQVDIAALGSFTGELGGATLDATQGLVQYARAFGMDYSAKSLGTWSADIFSGLTTEADIQARIRGDAASAYPAYSEQITKGVSLDALTSAYKSSMANILEMDPDTIGYNDPRLRKALQSTGADGKPITKPLWQFEKELRSTKEWEYTNNARDTMDQLSLKVLKDWGLA